MHRPRDDVEMNVRNRAKRQEVWHFLRTMATLPLRNQRWWTDSNIQRISPIDEVSMITELGWHLASFAFALMRSIYFEFSYRGENQRLTQHYWTVSSTEIPSIVYLVWFQVVGADDYTFVCTIELGSDHNDKWRAERKSIPMRSFHLISRNHWSLDECDQYLLHLPTSMTRVTRQGQRHHLQFPSHVFFRDASA